MKKPKAIKVFMNGKRLKDIYPHATPFQVFKYRVYMFLRRVVILALIVSAMFGIYNLGSYLNPATIYTTAEVVREVEIQAPILDRIAGCESEGNPKSKGTHYDKNGQVLLRGNTNKTVDVGKYQINSVWFTKATELGLDITKEKDNEAMALWIYKNKGTGDWYASSKCWK